MHCKSGDVDCYSTAYIPHSNGIGGTKITIINEDNVNRLVLKSEAMRKRKEKGFVQQTYIFWDRNNRAIKIGKTNNIENRKRGIRTSNPFCELIAIKDEDIEKELHESYKHINITLEWFKADENIIKEIITEYKFKQIIKL